MILTTAIAVLSLASEPLSIRWGEPVYTATHSCLLTGLTAMRTTNKIALGRCIVGHYSDVPENTAILTDKGQYHFCKISSFIADDHGHATIYAACSESLGNTSYAEILDK